MFIFFEFEFCKINTCTCQLDHICPLFKGAEWNQDSWEENFHNQEWWKIPETENVQHNITEFLTQTQRCHEGLVAVIDLQQFWLVRIDVLVAGLTNHEHREHSHPMGSEIKNIQEYEEEEKLRVQSGEDHVQCHCWKSVSDHIQDSTEPGALIEVSCCVSISCVKNKACDV